MKSEAAKERAIQRELEAESATELFEPESVTNAFRYGLERGYDLGYEAARPAPADVREAIAACEKLRVYCELRRDYDSANALLTLIAAVSAGDGWVPADEDEQVKERVWSKLVERCAKAEREVEALRLIVAVSEIGGPEIKAESHPLCDHCGKNCDGYHLER